MEVAAWLRGLGLEQYEPAFRESMLDLFCLRPFGSDGQGPGECEQATAQGRIVDPVIGADQFDRLAPAQRIGVEGFGSGFGKACGDPALAPDPCRRRKMKPGRPEPGSDHAGGWLRCGLRLAHISGPAERSSRSLPRAFPGSGQACSDAASRGNRRGYRSGSACRPFVDRAVASVGALPSLVDCPRKGSGVK